MHRQRPPKPANQCNRGPSPADLGEVGKGATALVVSPWSNIREGPESMGADGRGQRDAQVETAADVRERGANGQTSNRRLFVQFQAFTGCAETKTLVSALEAARLEAVLYADLSDPRGVGLLAWTPDPAVLATDLREMLGGEPFARLARRPEFAMLGRTYASGFEADLDDWLLHRPRRIVLDPDHPWAIWYPLRRSGAFARLDPKEQAAILREHGAVGRAYGDADF